MAMDAEDTKGAADTTKLLQNLMDIFDYYI